MTEPNDRESKPESPKAPGSPGVWLPPRLRDKLTDAEGAGEEEVQKKKPSPVGPILMLLVTVAVVGGVWWMIHSNQVKAKAEAARVAAAARAAAVADSLAQVRQADSLAAVARADSIAFAALPRWQQRKILAERAKLAAAASAAAGTPPSSAPSAGAAATAATGTSPAGAPAATPATGAAESTAAEAPAPRERGPFGIDAGQFIDEARASQVADALKAKLNMAAQVVTEGEGAGATYHVLLGSFSSRSAAEAKASSLLEKGLVEQGAVVALPKAR